VSHETNSLPCGAPKEVFISNNTRKADFHNWDQKLASLHISIFSSENFFKRTTYILFPGSELVSCDTVKSFAVQAKVVRSTTRQAKISGVEI
jgi:hypothetical protein